MRASPKLVGLVSSLLFAGTIVVATAAPGAGAAGNDGSSGAITTRVVKGGQTTRLDRGTAGGGEIAPSTGEEAATAQVPVANRSLSSRANKNGGGPALSGIVAPNSAVLAAARAAGFRGINNPHPPLH